MLAQIAIVIFCSMFFSAFIFGQRGLDIMVWFWGAFSVCTIFRPDVMWMFAAMTFLAAMIASPLVRQRV